MLFSFCASREKKRQFLTEPQRHREKREKDEKTFFSMSSVPVARKNLVSHIRHREKKERKRLKNSYFLALIS